MTSGFISANMLQLVYRVATSDTPEAFPLFADVLQRRARRTWWRTVALRPLRGLRARWRAWGTPTRPPHAAGV
jgi:hypothetical protein